MRFEIFKRDNFTCRYCGRKSPEVVLEVDHIVAVANGGQTDPINLATSCWECNRGKSAIPLAEIMTGEDPHDRAVLILESKRQLEEYNEVLRAERAQRIADHDDLFDYWTSHVGRDWITRMDSHWLLDVLQYVPVEAIRGAMDISIRNGQTKNLSYVGGIIRRWRSENGGDRG